MNLRKHAFSILYWVILTLVGGGFLVMLFLTRGDYVEVKNKLQNAERAYKGLTESNPFPSAENVTVMQTNLQRAVDFYVELQDRLCQNPNPDPSLGAAQFNVLLQDTFKTLKKEADWQGATEDESGTLLPEPFYFGFKQYTGALPDEGDIPRLIRQLGVIQAVSTLLFDNRVASLDSVDREIFEAGLADMYDSGGRGGAMLSSMTSGTSATDISDSGGGNDLYSVEHIDIAFHAKDEQLWSVIDALSSDPLLFVVVTDVSMENTSPPDVSAMALAGARDGGGGRERLEARREALRGGGGYRARTPMMAPDLMTRGGPAMGRGGYEYGTGRTPGGRMPTVAGEQQIVMAREDRVVAGRDEYVQVLLGLDVYDFCPKGEEDDPLAEGGEELP